ncbi:APC family permease [Geitlerinema splendidum]|nr:APC family permease [Geitlerinema splendidum]
MSTFSQLKKVLFGKPIASKHAHHERLAIPIGLAVFASDAISSVAYSTEEIMHVLAPTGLIDAYYKLIPVALALTILMLIVGFSYFQTIAAYPKGGGTYLVSTENLGSGAGRIAGASLLLDYVLTVAVSISSGTAAVVSMMPAAQPYMVQIGIGAVAILCLVNLRGAKESGLAFALPTYAFILALLALIAHAISSRIGQPMTPPDLSKYEGTAKTLTAVNLFILLKAFAASCTALTGTEAIADGVQAFKEPAAKNAQKTLALMIALLITLFVGVTYASMHIGLTPMSPSEDGFKTVLAQLASHQWGEGFGYSFLLISTAMILFLAANTAYADFPRLCSFVAKDGYLPRQLTTLGDRLVFQNGIIILSALAAILIFIFDADTHSLIPLYAMGVFISFTLSQLGMARRFTKERKQRDYRFAKEKEAGEYVDQKAHKRVHFRFRVKSLICGFGGLVTGGVTLILLVTKWSEKAYLVVFALAALLLMFRGIKGHYNYLAKKLTVQPTDALPEMKTATLLLVPRVHKGILKAIKYALVSSPDTRALHIALSPEEPKKLRKSGFAWV